MAAGDTFRAAARDQLEVWAEIELVQTLSSTMIRKYSLQQV